MKKVIVSSQVRLTDVYNDEWCPDPSYKRVIDTLNYTLRRCMSDKGTVDLTDVKISYEVLNNAND
ncbi:MAG: hypothetical protein J6B01_07645 [Ruminococcus sp.]|nr:hypothetical protein [Prevotella sp.]MBO5319658.1 hypothetical protein [Ruminococcus sp.]